MKFVDEADITVQAGNGGNGCLSFLREKFLEKGGPDGGDGGDGGSIYLVAEEALNTLVDMRYQPRYRARSGEPGGGRKRTGASGEDLEVKVPVGTSVIEADTGEVVGDLVDPGQRLLVAQGGKGGLGNTHFKSSTNRTPRQTTSGTPGEKRRLRLQLKLLADVGLLGLPNAGKSTLIRAVSAARPKVADYPFTTLVPNLGVVRVDAGHSFVMADIPGLIAGAGEGAGLGIRFLKHLARTSVLLHLVDVAPADGSDPAAGARTITEELEKFSPELARRERWLVFNKIDLLTGDALEPVCASVVEELAWDGPVHRISAATGAGVTQLCKALMEAVALHRNRLAEDEDFRREENASRARMQDEIMASIERSRALRRAAKASGDGGGPRVFYTDE